MAQQRLIEALTTQHLDADLKTRSIHGGMLTLTSQGAQFVIQSVSTIVLARILRPADFGLVAMATAVTSIGQAFADLGLSEATIQGQDILPDQVTNLFWINTGIGLLLTAVTAGLAPVLAWFYREPRLIRVTLLLSLIFLIGGLRVQHDALLKRQMKYSWMAVRDIASYLIAVALTIDMALHGFGYWSLVTLPLTSNTAQMLLSWLIVGWIPGLPRRGAQVRSMVTFGGNIAAAYVISNLNRNADNLLIGWRWGASPLGLYSRAYNLLMLPVRQLIGPGSSVAVPAFSRIQNDPERLARYYLRSASLMMWIAAPIFGFLFVSAKPVISMALGHQWMEAAPVFQILAISALGHLLLQSTNWLMVSRGESDRLLNVRLASSPVIILSYAIGLPYGIKGVALASSIVIIGILPALLKFTFRGTELTITRLAKAIFPAIMVTFTGVLLSETALELLVPHRMIVQLSVAALGFVVAYALALLFPPVREEAVGFRDFLISRYLSPGSAVHRIVPRHVA